MRDLRRAGEGLENGRGSMEERDEERIMQEFAKRRSRQVLAMAAAIALMILAAALYRRPDLFGEISKGTLVKAQLLIVLIFVNFTAFNWRCPSCRTHLGSDIGRQTCRKCGVRLR